MTRASVQAPVSPLVAIFILALLNISAADEKCDRLGFRGARLNPCGYCVGGSTGLDSRYGRDCKGVCGGTSRRDCNDMCGGSAYIEPCSRQCVYGKFSKVYGDNEALSQHRDCRGTCLASSGARSPYVTDSCGVCVRGPVSRESAYKDCLGICRIPGLQRERAELLCGNCVGGNGTVTKSDVMDACGNCKSTKAHCECEGKGERDICGVCSGKGSSCFLLTGISPSALPADVDVQVTLVGAFSGEKRDVLCVFRRREASDSGESIPAITAAGRGNGTHFVCQPKSFSQGTYLVAARLSRLGKEANNSNTLLTVFNQEGETPSQMT